MELISFAVPCMNRLDDLRQSMPWLLAAANACPPVEIAVLDYGSSDGLGDWMQAVMEWPMREGVSMRCRRYTGRDHYHNAHATNLAMLSTSGDYIVRMSADALPLPGFVPALRERIAEGCVWMYSWRAAAHVCIKRTEFIAAGGYDERFELYGAEDREFDLRLRRRGAKFGWLPSLLNFADTPDEIKTVNYRIRGNKSQHSKKMRPIYQESAENYTLIANTGKAWGAWA